MKYSFLIIAIIFPLTDFIYAQWSTSVRAESALYVVKGFYPTIESFSDGSAMFLGNYASTYAQYLDPNGNPKWNSEILVNGNDSTISRGYVKTARNLDKGVYVVWPDCRGSIFENGIYKTVGIFGQYLTIEGNLKWAIDGVRLVGAKTHPTFFEITVDGMNGLFLLYDDDSFGFSGANNSHRVYLKHISSKGTINWELLLDSNSTQSSLVAKMIGVIDSAIYIRINNYKTLSVNVNSKISRIDDGLDSKFYFIADSILYSSEIFSRQLLNDTLITQYTLNKYSKSGSTLWSSTDYLTRFSIYDFQVGEAKVWSVGDKNTGFYLVESMYNSNSRIPTTFVTHINNLGLSDWNPKSIIIPNYAGINASTDYKGAIVLSNQRNGSIVKIMINGNRAWSSQPITVIENVDIISNLVSSGDQNGGMIVSFWSTKGGLYAGHSGRNGKPGMITSVRRDLYPKDFQSIQNYPNPFNGTTTIVLPNIFSKAISFKVFDILGQKVDVEFQELKGFSDLRYRLSLNNLPSGVYLLTVTNKDKILSKKITYIK
jgi:hypothetical protein